jgi:hypothetical protein
MPRRVPLAVEQDPLLADGIVYCEGVAKGESFFFGCDPLSVFSVYSFSYTKKIWTAKKCTILMPKTPGRRGTVQRCESCASAAVNLSRWCTRERDRQRITLEKKHTTTTFSNAQHNVELAAAISLLGEQTQSRDFWINYFRVRKESGKSVDAYKFQHDGGNSYIVPCQGIHEDVICQLTNSFGLTNVTSTSDVTSESSTTQNSSSAAQNSSLVLPVMDNTTTISNATEDSNIMVDATENGNTIISMAGS